MNCAQCNEPADVIADDIRLCCEHYSRRTALMRRNADHLCYDPITNTYEPPTEEQRAVRDAADRSLLAGRSKAFERERARMRLQGAESAPRGLSSTRALVGNAGAQKVSGEG